uniref:Uncharacterized protein n=1 Tax=Homalodisca liturata TaxID=320908 RepID=A0A1B6IUK5_9HEMI
MADNDDELVKKINTLRLVPEKPLPEYLQLSECPFTWQPNRFYDVNPEEVINLSKEKAEYDDLPLDKFIRLLTLVYEFSHLKQFEEAEQALHNAEKLLLEEKGFGFVHATRHILLATQAHIFAMKGLENEEIKELEPYIELSKPDQAAVQALKAKFFSLYRKKGFQCAVDASRKALELNPEEPMWMFLLAESLRRQSKYTKSDNEPLREEVKLLEKAIEKDRNPHYIVHLALRYTLCAKNTFHQNKNNYNYKRSELCQLIDKMWEEVPKLCKVALELAPNNEVINRRCGHTLMQSDIKVQYKNKDLIRTALEKALELSPDSSMTLHYLGKFHERLDNNYKEAEKFYQKAAELDANLAAQFDLIRLKFKLHGVDKYDPSEDFENMLQKQSQLERHNWLKAKVHILSYDLFVKRDLKKVLEEFEIIIEDNEMYYFVKKHYFLFSERMDAIDLYKYIANELKIAEEDVVPNKHELLKKIENISPESVEGPGDKSLLNNVIKKFREPTHGSTTSYTGQRRRLNSDNASSSDTMFWRSNQNQQGSLRQNQSTWRPTGNRSSESSNWRQTGSKSSNNSDWRKRDPNHEE